jgi:geranylgeranyl diphosphate synthase type II
MHGQKTGALIRAACRMGALAGGVGPGSGELQAASEYGEAIGLAFQIADDLLDVTSTQQNMGKPTGADAAAGRATFPAVVGLERSQAMAAEQVARAVQAARRIEKAPGALEALARYAVERTS